MRRQKGPRLFAAAGVETHIENIPDFITEEAKTEFLGNYEGVDADPTNFIRDNISEFFEYFGLRCWNSEEADGFIYVGLPIEAWNSTEYGAKDQFLEDAAERILMVLEEEGLEGEIDFMIEIGSPL